MSEYAICWKCVTKAERIAELEAELEDLRTLVSMQAEDEGLWCDTEDIFTAYLQQEIRVLHAAVEGDDV